jgi:hypothetical protein
MIARHGGDLLHAAAQPQRRAESAPRRTARDRQRAVERQRPHGGAAVRRHRRDQLLDIGGRGRRHHRAHPRLLRIVELGSGRSG